MSLSAQNTPGALASATDDAWLCLLTITPTSVGSIPFHLVNNNEDVVSRGVTFKPFPFTFVLPADDGENLPKVSIVIDNVDESIVRAIRAELEPPMVKLEIATSAFPNIVEKSLDFLKLRTVNYTSMTIEGTLETINVLNSRFPNGDYTAVQFPALFR